jgi:hypothetical protein
MIYSFWRLNEYTPDNLGLAFTDDGLLLGQTPLVERRDGRFVARERSEIERLLKRAHPGAPPVDRIISGLATVASALNANDQCLARIAAVHLRIPELPSSAARAALAAEDTLIKYARDEGSTSSALKRMRQRSRRGWVSAAVRRKSALWLPQRQVSSSTLDAAPRRKRGYCGTLGGKEDATGDNRRGAVNPGCTDRYNVGRDQGLSICQCNQTNADSGRGSRNFRKGIDIDYRNKNENKSQSLGAIQSGHSAFRFGTAVKENDMIKAVLKFPLSTTDLVTKTILSLPEILRPAFVSLAEDEVGTAIGDVNVFLQTFKMPTIGVYLQNSTALYDLRRSRNSTLIVDADLDAIPDDTVRDFLIRMAIAHPIFGFACAGEELEYRNRITTQLGINTIHSWVGRDTRKYLPGLYWWTLLPASLAEQHGIPLSTIVDAAQEHIELEGKQHLLRFYEKPEDWQSAAVTAQLYPSLPGVFDVEKLRPKLQVATTFLELNAILDAWS